MLPFVLVGIGVVLLGGGLIAASRVPDDAITALSLPGGRARRMLLPLGVFIMIAGVAVPITRALLVEPPATPPGIETETPVPTITETALPTIPLVPTITPSPTITPTPGTPAPQQFARHL